MIQGIQHTDLSETPQHNVLNPNVRQRMASNPMESIWVGASAGTGKTKVLTDRVLRLLLPRDDGQPGTPPNRILCLTFTKAAANEMALRINETLGVWAVMEIDHDQPKQSLRATLANLLGHPPNEEQLHAAQQLFANVIDCPGGMQIMTIHSFCQSVLGRFPLEADLPPNFTIMEEAQAAQLMQESLTAVMARAQEEEETGSPLGQALHNLATDLDEQSFGHLVRDVCSERHQLSRLLERYKTAEGIYAAVCDHYNIAPNVQEGDLKAQICGDPGCDEAALLLAADAMMQDKGKKAPIYGAQITAWIKAPMQERIATYTEYCQTFLKPSDGQPRTQSFPPKSALTAFPACEEVLSAEARRLLEGQEQIKRARSAAMTRDIMTIGAAVLQRYTYMKQAQGMLDFDDLVIRTMELLAGQTVRFDTLEDADKARIPNWIMYKLDQGLDHILVDEAQDTNPEQWRIIEALCEEFFSGMGARDDVVRTSFTVGDIKQSIYSFQRAAPEEFQRMQRVFDEKIIQAKQINRNISLDISFRSTASVLHVVDRVFEVPHLKEAVGGGEISHTSFRSGQAGRVELWPCFQSAKTEQRDFWDPPVVTRSQQSGSAQLAAYTAQQIRGWLDRKEVLESYDRPIQPGDIMILVKSRSAFVEQLVREMKGQNIPVSGADRMVLGDQLAVQDIFAMARFCLLPSDDLTLAEVLKSPFLGWTEDELFSLAYNRKGTLWQELCNFDQGRLEAIETEGKAVTRVDDAKRSAARDYLARLVGRAKYLGAYEFFAHILNKPCPADDISGLRAVRHRLGDDALDPIEELMNAALSYGRDHIDHMQMFLDHQAQTDIEIKREMEEQGGQVRIMTVHGSKGLQAPIVIMPDTLLSSSAKKGGRLLWPSKTELPIPLYSARNDDDPQAYRTAYQRCEDLDTQEYYRLLYVAMTRAADRLYIAGYTGTRKAKEQSWYYVVQAAMERDARCEALENGHLRIENPQEKAADKVKKQARSHHMPKELPAWARQQAPEEPFPPRPLIPSAPSDDERDVALSPLRAGNEYRFRRGNITHKLLQFLPDFAPDKRAQAAERYVEKAAHDLNPAMRDSIVQEVMHILEASEYAPFFAQNSMAEVSVTGLMQDNRIVSGQIDRLVIGEEDIWIIDYKTNRPPPKNPDDVPVMYKNQMAAYRDSIQAIYPDHRIHCALLWTDGPFLTLL